MGLTWGTCRGKRELAPAVAGRRRLSVRRGRGGIERGKACSGSWLIFARDKLAATTERPVRGVDIGGSKGCGAVDWRCFASSKRPPSRVSGLQRDKWADPGRDGETATGRVANSPEPRAALTTLTNPPRPQEFWRAHGFRGAPSVSTCRSQRRRTWPATRRQESGQS